MRIKANIRLYLILICVLAIVMLLIFSGLSVDRMAWGIVLPCIIIALVLGALRVPSIVGAEIDSEFVQFKVLRWSGFHTSTKYPIHKVKCERELHSLTKGGSRDFRYNFYFDGKKIGTLYAFTIYWEEELLEKFMGFFGPGIFKA